MKTEHRNDITDTESSLECSPELDESMKIDEMFVN